MSQALPPRSTKSSSEEPKDPFADSPNQENYSLDEMLNALREGEREKESEGEIVTRSDGSVARKVRHRKRRSDQPEASQKKPGTKPKKSLLFKVIVGVSLFLVAVLAMLFTLLSHNSKIYRAEVEKKAGEWSGAEVELDALRLMPGSISMNRAQFDWPEHSYLKSLELRRLSGHADVTSFLWARMGGREVGGAVGTLVIQNPVGEGSIGKSLEEEDFPFNFRGYYCDSLNVQFGESELFSIKGTNTSLRYLNGEGFRAKLDEGSVKLDGWESLPIENGLIDFSDGNAEIVAVNLGQPTRLKTTATGSIELSGIMPLTNGEKANFEISTTSYPLEALLGDRMGKFFSGLTREMAGSVTYEVGNESYGEIAFNFEADLVEMKRFPFIKDLDEIFPTEGFDPINFDNEISGDFSANSRGLSLQNLKLFHKDVLRLKADILIAKSGKIGGRCTLEINRGLINVNEELKRALGSRFTDQPYHKVEFRLGGTLDAPDDTFRYEMGLTTALPATEEKSEKDLEDEWARLIGANPGAEKKAKEEKSDKEKGE